MKFRHILLGGLVFDLALAATAAGAARLVVSPDRCPAPAEAEPYVLEDGVAPPEEKARPKIEKSLVLLYDARLSGGRGNGPFGRLLLDMETGLPLEAEAGAEHGPDCAR
ncbi:MAG: hypothetical protein AB7P23_10525 [Amphiplicatus sp.]